MEAEDLMIGDYVYFSTKNHIVQVVRMNGMRYSFNQQDIILYGDCFGKDKFESHIAKSLSPIPLTQSILEKIGFENFGFFGKLVVGKFNIICDCLHLTIIDEVENRKLIDIPCTSVHVFQHATKLLGIKINIKL